MPTRSSRPPVLLFFAALFGAAAVVLAFVGLGGFDGRAADVVARASRSVSTLTFGLTDAKLNANGWITGSRVFALFAGFTAVLGVLVELSPGFRDTMRRLRFWWLRVIGRRPAVVIGLGWIGGPLVAELCTKGRPVYGVALDASSPRVASARRNGALLLLGDASDDDVRARLGLTHAAEVFVSTGDDARNLEIAGDLLRDAETQRIGHRSLATSLACFVHIADPVLASTIDAHELFADPTHEREERLGVRFVPFRAPDLTARQLFLQEKTGLARSPDTVPAAGEVFHLILFGFGPTGQTVALTAARLAHFPNGLRTRLTVVATSDAERAAWADFQERHPAFTAAGLTLDSAAFRDAGDGWNARPGQPTLAAFQFEDSVCVDKRGEQVIPRDAAVRPVRPVEYAVNAERLDAPTEPDAAALVEALLRRLDPRSEPRVKAACVVCYEEDRRSFHTALRLRTALAVGAHAAEWTPTCTPIYVHLPTESGLEGLLHRQRPSGGEMAKAEAPFPLRTFGQRGDVVGYDAIVREKHERRARLIQSTHHRLSGRVPGSHPDFAHSDDDAAQHIDVKLDTLGIKWASADRLADVPHGARLLFGDLVSRKVLDDERILTEENHRHHRRPPGDTGPLRLLQVEFDALPPLLRQRLALLERIHIPPVTEQRPYETPCEEKRRLNAVAFKAAVDGSIEEALSTFAEDLPGGAATLVARMEHNRWMGERLAAGWRFGSECNVRRQRVTMVPWEDLDDDEKIYDRIQLPRLILEQGPAWDDPSSWSDAPGPDRFVAYIAPRLPAASSAS